MGTQGVKRTDYICTCSSSAEQHLPVDYIADWDDRPPMQPACGYPIIYYSLYSYPDRSEFRISDAFIPRSLYIGRKYATAVNPVPTYRSIFSLIVLMPD